MAAFYLDHNVALETARLLRKAGHSATTAREIGLAAVRDDEHLPRSASERRTLVTHNAGDFILLHDAWLRWSRA